MVEIRFDDARHLLRSDVIAGLDDQLFKMLLTCGRLASHNLDQVSLEVGKYPFSTVELARPGRNAQHREIRLDELDGLFGQVGAVPVDHSEGFCLYGVLELRHHFLEEHPEVLLVSGVFADHVDWL